MEEYALYFWQLCLCSLELLRKQILQQLKTCISEWKGKYEETVEQLQANQKTIKDYKNKLEKNEEASGLVDKELKDSNMILGKTDVFGEGVTIPPPPSDASVVFF